MNNSLLFKAIASAIVGTQISDNLITDSELEDLYNTSKAHDVAHLVGYSLDKNALLSGKIAEKFKKQVYLAVYRYQMITHEVEAICSTLEADGIDHIALKGARMCKLYPQPWMRTSCDIDILVKKEDLECAIDSLVKKLNYSTGKMNYHDISLFSESGVHLELHFSIRENMKSIDFMLDRVWEHSALIDGKKHSFEQSPEFFIFHNVTHMSYHFTHGGCGIRPFIDLYLLKNSLSFNEDELQKLLCECSLERFYECACHLSDVWLGDKEHSEATRQMEDYILKGGVYGSFENGVSAQQSINGGRFRHVMSKVFIPRDVLMVQFPIVEKHKYLTPAMQVARWFKVIFNGRAMREINCGGNIDKEQAKATADMLSNIGLMNIK